ncbi:MAG: hypothetical protein ACD_81C00114G0003 [uncultured bacterium]|uniref:DUF5666 domain-containing protein n=1 Tax=Candidatus Wolfebacteria bacterium GW2011_GWE2_44_13 TaxID=1619017 RepID=A0A0G1HAS7_9BACT|nr:MAG: hypothetical protein ACD_81C00114G0003 [uncultured bacterium]KKT43618.1 MAG: hypothetical protein UW32_C0001G0210 [Candidatus Wolfebacteria bacterium GW2011_GWE2_44_13]
MTKQQFKKYFPIIVIIGIISAGSFYAGMRYERGGSDRLAQNNGMLLAPAERQARMASGGLNGAQRNVGARTNGGGLVAGEIIAKDATSITVKLRDGGSKIVFLSNTTSVMKSTNGSTEDLVIGAQVTTTGTTNTDGSITAQSVQLRTDMQ